MFDTHTGCVITAWFAGSRLADVVLAATVIEFVMLAGWHARTGGGLSLPTLMRMLLPGVFLTLALRVALVGGAVTLLASCLVLAGLTHLVDVHARWSGQRSQ